MALAKVGFYDLRYDHRHRSPVLFLKDAERDKYLPVWIGELEASSIELAVIRKSAPRPLTHDLFATVLRELGIGVRKVVIDRLESRTYYATIYLDRDGDLHTVDCRPSDAVAIALRENCEIFVDDELMYNIKFVELEDSAVADDEDEDINLPEQAADEESFQQFLKRITPSDFKDG